MQRVLLVIVLLLLLVVSLAAGALAAAWPFWSRALAWGGAPDGWPVTLPGPVRQLRGAAAPAPLLIRPDPELARVAAASGAQVLLVADGPATARGWFASGIDEHSIVDGRGLTPGLLPLVYAALAPRHPDLLDQPVGRYLREWAQDPRGAITPRQMMWDLSGLPGGSRRPWNPFDPQAQLLAGPDFTRAALAVRQAYPAGTTSAQSPANAQLLALVAGRVASRSYADLLEEVLWRGRAAGTAYAALDHPRGEIAAHCCINATARDWLGVALLLAQQGHAGARELLPPQFLAEVGVDHPVNPGQGLVWRIESAAGVEVLLLRTAGRLLMAMPGSGQALFWSGDGELPIEEAVRLLEPRGGAPQDSGRID